MHALTAKAKAGAAAAHLEPHSRDVSHGVPSPPETCNEHLILRTQHTRACQLHVRGSLEQQGGSQHICTKIKIQEASRRDSAGVLVRAGPLTFSSMKLRQPSLGTNAAIFLPFLISCTRAHFRMAELGCLASIPLRGSTVRQPTSNPAAVAWAACSKTSIHCGLEQGVQIRTHIFSRTMPLACEAPAKGFFHSFPRWLFL